MNDNERRIHWITPLVILALLSWNACVSWAEWGKLVYIGLLAVPFLIVLFMSILKKPLPADFLVEDAKLSRLLNNCFIPGWRLLEKDLLERAKKGPTGSRVSLNALLVLVLIMTGMAFFSTTETLIKIQFIPTDWFAWTNKDLWVWVFLLNGFVYVLLTLLVNLLTAHTFSLGYQIDSAKHLRELALYFGLNPSSEDYTTDYADHVPRSLFWSTFSQHLDNIYGHKVWSGRGICTLLDGIRAKKEMLGTSQWFLLEFAADVLDHHIEEDKLCIRMSYGDPGEYSQFLARTMRYCTKNIIWIVDRRDFVTILFPIMIREVLFSLVQMFITGDDGTAPEPDKTLCKSLSNMASEHHEKNSYELAADIPGFCEICRHNDQQCKTASHLCSIAIRKDKEEVWLPVLEDFQSWVVRTLSSLNEEATVALCKHDAIWDLCKNRCTDSLGFPHIRSYYSHGVPKSRIIELPSHPLGHAGDYTAPNIQKDSFERIVDRLFFIVEGEKGTDEASIGDALSQDDLPSKIRNLADHFLPVSIPGDRAKTRIFLQAWKLFGSLSNSESMQQVVGFAEVARLGSGVVKRALFALDEAEPSLDIGVYDNCVMVNSRCIGRGEADESRFVIWAMVEGAPIQQALSVFDPTRELDDDERRVFRLSDFINSLEGSLEP